MRFLLLVAASALIACAQRPPVATAIAPANPDPALAAIEGILTAFTGAIVARDGDRMASLMLDPEVPFNARAVASGKTFASTGGSFARDITAATTRWEEQFSDVVIVAKDGVATLDSSYRFLEDGRLTNHGREVWTLIETAGGWKITSVSWSIIKD
jgi:hypothetical protein